MGRHSSPEPWSFYRSITAWVLPWALVAVIVGTGVWIVVSSLGRDELETPPPLARHEGSKASPVPKGTVLGRTIERREQTGGSKEPLDPDGVTVQVLNGTSLPEADDRMVERLSTLGYDVIAMRSASKAYARTTVFWSYADARRSARELAQRFGWRAAPRPQNLSATAAVHVVVGGDEA